MKQLGIGIIGCGNIFSQYAQGLNDVPECRLLACADVKAERARGVAQEFGIPKACSVDEMLRDPQIDIVVNLTTPDFHAPLSSAILESGKHAYSEKPLAVSRGEGANLAALMDSCGKRLACAPDTFLGSGLQTTRKAIDDGLIGTPSSCTAFLCCPGHEHWHPNPGFFYRPGGGPLFDMGPYYLTHLVNLLGPVALVSAITGRQSEERSAKDGSTIKVEIDTHISASLRFASGAIGTLIMSFDVPGHHLPFIEVHGTKASLSVPNPNRFTGPLQIRQRGKKEWTDIAMRETPYDKRGSGVRDLSIALENNTNERCHFSLALHVLDIMQSILDSGTMNRPVSLTSTCERPAGLL